MDYLYLLFIDTHPSFRRVPVISNVVAPHATDAPLVALVCHEV